MQNHIACVLRKHSSRIAVSPEMSRAAAAVATSAGQAINPKPCAPA